MDEIGPEVPEEELLHEARALPLALARRLGDLARLLLADVVRDGGGFRSHQVASQRLCRSAAKFYRKAANLSRCGRFHRPARGWGPGSRRLRHGCRPPRAVCALEPIAKQAIKALQPEYCPTRRSARRRRSCRRVSTATAGRLWLKCRGAVDLEIVAEGCAGVTKVARLDTRGAGIRSTRAYPGPADDETPLGHRRRQSQTAERKSYRC